MTGAPGGRPHNGRNLTVASQRVQPHGRPQRARNLTVLQRGSESSEVALGVVRWSSRRPT
ncbi:hypothetical protein ACFPM0_16435 [Pseudonocardia sulfidoxydans]|uniref:hypothetical protein n=1 Tax=Pseudonocardia sulfidoxydans TaxID=54011 RepID=UPI0036237D07